MHQGSMEKMAHFRDKYLLSRKDESLVILDVGSYDVNGTYRSLFEAPNWTYVGVDQAPGANVDVVLADPYHFRGIRSESIDVVVTGQTFEHVEYFWVTMLEIARVMKPGAVCCIVVPSSGPRHLFPVDCWRFFPDGLSALARHAGLVVREVSLDNGSKVYPDRSEQWNDAVLVCAKPLRSVLGGMRRRLSNRIQHGAFRLARALNGGG
jgi:SAM-dependent methyltransferase